MILKHYKKNIYTDSEILQNQYYVDKYSNIDLWQGINSLDYDLKLVTILFYFEDMAQKDISKVLKIPEGTVRSRLNRSRKILLEIIK